MFCRATLAAMRVRKDLEEITDTKSSAGIATTTVDYCTPDLLTLHITLHMETGIYMGASFTFVIEVPANYPFTAPRVTSTGRIWHPSVHLTTGCVRLPILEADWRPVLTIHTVVFALQLMLLEPSHEYPANDAAAAAALSTPDVFREQVRCTLRGGWFVGHEF
ncbi:ubiquitin-conjugating enzyme/RWD-like protein, partial [Tribonema minus]